MIRDSVKNLSLSTKEFAIDVVENSADSFFVKNIQHPLEITQILLLDIGLPGTLRALRPYLWSLINIRTQHCDADYVWRGRHHIKSPLQWCMQLHFQKAYPLRHRRSPANCSQVGRFLCRHPLRGIVNHLMGGGWVRPPFKRPTKEILERLVDGKSYQTIASELFISVETVEPMSKKKCTSCSM